MDETICICKSQTAFYFMMYEELNLGLQGCDLGLSPVSVGFFCTINNHKQNAACVHAYSAVSTSTQHTVLL